MRASGAGRLFPDLYEEVHHATDLVLANWSGRRAIRNFDLRLRDDLGQSAKWRWRAWGGRRTWWRRTWWRRRPRRGGRGRPPQVLQRGRRTPRPPRAPPLSS